MDLDRVARIAPRPRVNFNLTEISRRGRNAVGNAKNSSLLLQSSFTSPEQRKVACKIDVLHVLQSQNLQKDTNIARVVIEIFPLLMTTLGPTSAKKIS